MASELRADKPERTIYISLTKDERKAIEGCKIGDTVTVMVSGKIKGLSQRTDGASIDVGAPDVSIEKKGRNPYRR